MHITIYIYANIYVYDIYMYVCMYVSNLIRFLGVFAN